MLAQRAVCFACILAICLGLVGCDDLLDDSKKKAKVEPEKPKLVHHFDQIARSEGSLAVDTATGQMCKTWDWYCAKPNHKNPYTGQWEESSEYGMACSAIAALPTCESIVKADQAPQPNPSR